LQLTAFFSCRVCKRCKTRLASDRREKYIYALMSAVSIFCLGAGASLLHGVQALFEPPHLQDMAYSLFGEWDPLLLVASSSAMMRLT
jgi:hypothetical protein